MRSVNIGELKNQLSSYLHRVRGGEEVIVRDRNQPIARIIPFVPQGNLSEEEQALVESGDLLPPRSTVDWKSFHVLMGPGVSKAAVARAFEEERSGDR